LLLYAKSSSKSGISAKRKTTMTIVL
jgi:hypothetical protein